MEIFNLSEGISQTIITLISLFLVYLVISIILKRLLLKKVRSKKSRHNIIVFINLITYIFIFVSVVIVFVSYTGGLTGVGITAGLLTAALGWALQRPITGIAAWLMVIITKPFEIGDRIIIGNVKGDVTNITITHIFLEEFGGTVGGEEISGRIIIIPNAVLFEQNVVNYTSQNDYILDEVAFSITYSSNVDLARTIAIRSAKEITKDFIEKVKTKPFVRINFQPSGVDVRVRFYTIAPKRQEINSKISEEIFNGILKERKVEFAYPHTQVVLEKK